MSRDGECCVSLSLRFLEELFKVVRERTRNNPLTREKKKKRNDRRLGNDADPMSNLYYPLDHYIDSIERECLFWNVEKSVLNIIFFVLFDFY